MVFRINYIVLLVIGVFLLSCSTGPEFERDNENDPSSTSFEPDTGDLTVSIDSTKNVTLEWNDLSEFEDGFIVHKSYGENDNFFDLDTLPPNTSNYVDISKKLSADTFYKVSAFSKNSDSFGSTEIDKLDFEPLHSYEAPHVPSNNISISWVKSLSGYADAFLLEKKADNEDWVLIDTVESSISNYLFQEPRNIFYLDIRITPLLLNYKNEYVSIKEYPRKRVALNFPNNLKATAIDEGHYDISWDNGNDFSNRFIIYIRSKAYSCCSYSFTPWIAIDTVSQLSSTTLIPSLPDHNHKEISVAELSENGTVSQKTQPLQLDFYINPPTKISVESISDEKAILKWEDKQASKRMSYHIYRSINSEEYEEIAVLEPSASSYDLVGLDPANKYNFTIRSYNSTTSGPLSLEYRPSIEKTNQIPANNVREIGINHTNHSLTFTDENNYSYHYDVASNNLLSFPIKPGAVTDLLSSKSNDLLAHHKTHYSEEEGLHKSIIYINDIKNNGQIVDSLILPDPPSYSSWESINLLNFYNENTLFFSDFTTTQTQFSTTTTSHLLRWNRLEKSVDTLATNPYRIMSLYFDQKHNQFITGLNNKLVSMSLDGLIFKEIKEVGFNADRISRASNDKILFNYLDYSFNYYNFDTNTFREVIGMNTNLSDYEELASYNYVIVSDYRSSSPYRSTLRFFDSNTFEHLFNIQIDAKVYRSLYNEEQNSLFLITNNGLGIYSVTPNWISVNK